jgi:hypothetical protein
MAQPILLSPSILSADFTRLGDQLKEAEQAGADWFHIDVMDGHFVPNLTMGPFIVEACRRATRLPLDVHLMIEAPERLVKAFVEAGADWLTVHQETCPHLHRTLSRSAAWNQGRGFLNGHAGEHALESASLDLILIMTVDRASRRHVHPAPGQDPDGQRVARRGPDARPDRGRWRDHTENGARGGAGRRRCVDRRQRRVQTSGRDPPGDAEPAGLDPADSGLRKHLGRPEGGRKT